MFTLGERRAERRARRRSGAHNELLPAVSDPLAAWIRKLRERQWNIDGYPSFSSLSDRIFKCLAGRLYTLDECERRPHIWRLSELLP